MRISVKKNDPGFSPDHYLYVVYFNEQLLNNCFTADTKLNKAWVYLVDENNNFILDENGKVQTTYLCGDIRIIKQSGIAGAA